MNRSTYSTSSDSVVSRWRIMRFSFSVDRREWLRRHRTDHPSAEESSESVVVRLDVVHGDDWLDQRNHAWSREMIRWLDELGVTWKWCTRGTQQQWCQWIQDGRDRRELWVGRRGKWARMLESSAPGSASDVLFQFLHSLSELDERYDLAILKTHCFIMKEVVVNLFVEENNHHVDRKHRKDDGG